MSPRLSGLFFFQAEDGIRDIGVTGVQTCVFRSTLRWSLGFDRRDIRDGKEEEKKGQHKGRGPKPFGETETCFVLRAYFSRRSSVLRRCGWFGDRKSVV